jgi:signal transduction histidine kinase
MQQLKLISLTALTALTLNQAVIAQEQATAAEVMEKVQAASEALKANPDAVADFAAKDSKWKWKDTYVFVYDCKGDKAIAHPTLTDKTIMDIKDKEGVLVFGGDKGLCKAGEREGGGWVSYMWAKPGATDPSQKISFAQSVAGTDLQVSAGIYSDEFTVDGFMLKKK